MLNTTFRSTGELLLVHCHNGNADELTAHSTTNTAYHTPGMQSDTLQPR
jgi:hypothetical protein